MHWRNVSFPHVYNQNAQIRSDSTQKLTSWVQWSQSTKHRLYNIESTNSNTNLSITNVQQEPETWRRRMMDPYWPSNSKEAFPSRLFGRQWEKKKQDHERRARGTWTSQEGSRRQHFWKFNFCSCVLSQAFQAATLLSALLNNIFTAVGPCKCNDNINFYQVWKSIFRREHHLRVLWKGIWRWSMPHS